MIPKSVAAYESECEAILSFFEKGTWLHQDDFDRKSREWRRSPGKRKLHGYTGETIVLPFQGDPLLAILQEFQRAGHVESETDENGTIRYRRAQDQS